MSARQGYGTSTGYGRERERRRSEAGGGLQPDAPVQFYTDAGKENINPELLDKIAEEKADRMHTKINSAQLRRFFGEVKELYNRLQHRESFERLLPLIKMIKSKAHYAFRREKIPREFGNFILGGIKQVEDEADFRAFVLYFEAVVGFMYGKGLVKK